MEHNHGVRRRRSYVLMLVAAGVAVAAVAAGVLLVVVPGEGEPPEVARPPRAAPPATSTPTPTSTAAPTPTVTATPTPAVTATPTPESTATPTSGITATPSPTPTATPAPHGAFSYDTYDTTGAVMTPGSYAFLTEVDEGTTTAATTYEALRDGTTARLRIHTSDADGVSRSAIFDDVEAGDLFEWKQADACFVRYTVTSTPQPAAGALWREFGVEWMTYAFTGCSGVIPASIPTSVQWGPLPILGGTSLTVPVRHGPIQLVPVGWTGAVEAEEFREVGQLSLPDSTEDIAVARTYEFWREPRLPDGWTFARASKGTPVDPPRGFCADYETPDGLLAAEICGGSMGGAGLAIEASWTFDDGAGLGVVETRVIHGRPAIATSSPRRPEHTVGLIEVVVYDVRANVAYSVFGAAHGDNPDPAIAIAASLFDDTDRDLPVTLTYDTYDLTGEVTEPGSYAFLTTAGDGTTTALTTHEALRREASTLMIHKSDASGASRATTHDAIRAGDTFEWRYAHDCWVGFRVTEVKPDPTGAEPRKLFAVRPYAHTYTGCSGAITTDAAARQVWRALPAVGGTNVAAPTVVGGFQVIPEDWEGDDLHYGLFSPPPSYSVPMSTTALAEARNLPFWRDLPEGWVFLRAGTGAHDDPHYGYCSQWMKGEHRVDVCGGYAANRESPIRGRAARPDSQLAQINELRVVGAYVFAVTYYTNISDWRSAPIYVHVFDDDAQSYHSFSGRSVSLSGSNVDALVEVAASVFKVSERE